MFANQVTREVQVDIHVNLGPYLKTLKKVKLKLYNKHDGLVIYEREVQYMKIWKWTVKENMTPTFPSKSSSTIWL